MLSCVSKRTIGNRSMLRPGSRLVSCSSGSRNCRPKIAICVSRHSVDVEKRRRRATMRPGWLPCATIRQDHASAASKPGAPVLHGAIISICPPASRWLNCRRRSVAAPVVVRPMSSGTIAKTVNSLKSRYTPIAVCCGGDAISRSAAARIVTAAAPPKLLPKGRYGISVWVEILLGKFASQRPTERLLAQWKLSGLDLAAGTVTGGLQRLEPLFVPLYEALVARQQQARYWQADETRWYVFADQEGKVGHRWWLWVFVSEDCTVFYLDPRRSRRVPQEHLPQRLGQVDSGVMMVDRFACYKAIAQVKKGEVVLVYCWAHVRRDFVRLGLGFPELRGWSLDWLRHIRRLYRLYQQRKQAYAQVSDSPAAADQEVRQHLQSMQQEARMQLAEPSLRRPCRKVLKSLQEHWEGLTRFADDPSIPLDNNACERQLRGPALGRKNYYGSGALWSGRLAAMLFSLLGTLERCRINPRQWLTDYLQACAAAGGRPPPNLDPWLPWQYQPTTMPTAPASNLG